MQSFIFVGDFVLQKALSIYELIKNLIYKFLS